MSIHVWNFDDVDDSEEVKQLKEENAQLREIIKNAPHTEDCDISNLQKKNMLK